MERSTIAPWTITQTPSGAGLVTGPHGEMLGLFDSPEAAHGALKEADRLGATINSKPVRT